MISTLNASDPYPQLQFFEAHDLNETFGGVHQTLFSAFSNNPGSCALVFQLSILLCTQHSVLIHSCVT